MSTTYAERRAERLSEPQHRKEVATMPKRDADGRAVRPTRPRQDFESDLTTVEGLVQYADFYLQRAANTAAFCMNDHLQDRHVIRDMHDIIGDLGSVRNTLQLMLTRAETKVDAGVASAVAREQTNDKD
jgi:hypothetical protein